MKTTYDTEARKRPVNLTLNEDLIVQVRGLTDNLSGVVESLLADYVEHERQQHLAKARMLDHFHVERLQRQAGFIRR